MNGDTFVGLSAAQSATQYYRNNLLPLTALGTVETIFTMAADTASTGVNAFVQVPLATDIRGSQAPIDANSNQAVLLGNLGRPGQDYRGARPYFNSNSLNGRPLVLQSSGYFTTSAVDSATGHAFNLYQATAANGSQLTTKSTVFQGLSSATLAAGNYNYLLIATLIWDSVSQSLTGFAEGVVGGTYTSRTAITGITVTTPTNLFFFPSVKFNTGAANTVTPEEFNISQQ